MQAPTVDLVLSGRERGGDLRGSPVEFDYIEAVSGEHTGAKRSAW